MEVNCKNLVPLLKVTPGCDNANSDDVC